MRQLPAACWPVLFYLAGASDAAGGTRPSGQDRARGLQDLAALLQGGPAQVQRHGAAPAQEDKWQPLGDVWDDVRDSVLNISDQVGDIAGGVDQKVDEVQATAGEAGDTIAKAVAKAINAGLVVVRSELDELVVESEKVKQSLLHEFCAGARYSNNSIIAKLEAAEAGAIEGAVAHWQAARDELARATSSLASGLQAARQERLGTILSDNVKAAAQNLDDFIAGLQTTREDLHGLLDVDRSQVREPLLKVDAKINNLMDHIARFAVMFEHAFHHLLDTLSNALPWSQHVDESFGAVQQTVTSIVWRSRSASRELLMSFHQAIACVGKTQRIEVPAWKPHPIHMPTAWDSASGRGADLLGLWQLLAPVAFCVAATHWF